MSKMRSKKYPIALTIEIDSEHCTFVYPLTARNRSHDRCNPTQRGMPHIAKTKTVGTAIQPAADRWVKDPRAHLRWKPRSAATNQTSMARTCSGFITTASIMNIISTTCRGVDGWSVHINKETKDITVVQTIDQGSGNAAYSAAS